VKCKNTPDDPDLCGITLSEFEKVELNSVILRRCEHTCKILFKNSQLLGKYCQKTLEGKFLRPPAVGGIKQYRDPSVRLSQLQARSCPSYRHAGCLQLSHVRTADPTADGRRSAASRVNPNRNPDMLRCTVAHRVGGLRYVLIYRVAQKGDTLFDSQCAVLSVLVVCIDE